MFKNVFLIILLFPLVISAQRLPEIPLNKVRLIYPDKTVQATVHSEPEKVTAKPGLNYYWYKANAIQVTQGGYSGQLLDGAYTEFFTNKNLKSQGIFKLGLKTGDWKTWHPGGTLAHSYHWASGALNGKFVLYDSTGIVTSTGTYKNGLLDGTVKSYHGKDSVTTVQYRKGKIVPPGKPFLQHFKFLKRKRTTRDSTVS